MVSIYGIIISSAILVAVLIAEKLASKIKKDPETIWSGSLWIVILGLVGARIYHVLDYSSYYFENPARIFQVWKGGLGILGGLIGGFLGAFIYLKIFKKEKLAPWLDIAAVVLPLAQAIGRWGNFFNQEAFGLPTKLPWGIYIQPQNRPYEYLSYNKFHPLFLYECILNFALFVFLYYLFNKKTVPQNNKTRTQEKPTGLLNNLPFKEGTLFLLYVIGYSSIRFFLEFLRIESWTLKEINVAQGITAISLLVSSVILLNLMTKKPKQKIYRR